MIQYYVADETFGGAVVKAVVKKENRQSTAGPSGMRYSYPPETLNDEMAYSNDQLPPTGGPPQQSICRRWAQKRGKLRAMIRSR